MRAIVAVDDKWGIGKDGKLLFSVPADMKFFKEKTTGKVVVMGSKTLKSFPGGLPLKNRTNIVFTSGVPAQGCLTVRNLAELFALLKSYDDNDVFIIGGGMFYKTMLPYCSGALVTKIEADGEADVFFENLDRASGWKCVAEGDTVISGGYRMKFAEYENSDVKKF